MPSSIEVGLGPVIWAGGAFALAALLIVCLTCVVLARTKDADAAEVLKAFAEVIRALFRRHRTAEVDTVSSKERKLNSAA